MLTKIFITGTDTGVGKTTIACCLIQSLVSKGMTVAAMKPIASGCVLHEGIWKNDDALKLQEATNVIQSYEQINPIALVDPVAPHIAARNMGVNLSAGEIEKRIVKNYHENADVIIIEGAGGWLLPLNSKEFFSTVVTRLKIPVILVIGLKLGCLNHAMLSYQSITGAGANFLGWVGNCTDQSMYAVSKNISALRELIPSPCFGVLAFSAEKKFYLDAKLLMEHLFQ